VADVTIPTSAGGMPGYLSRPDGQGPWPGVVVLHDGFGIDQAVREQADWLAGAGYLALLQQSAGQPGAVAGILARITHAGYHEASARDARSRMIAFFDAHLKQ